ncbi:MAG: hypothetical protein OEM39_06455 [Acidimicrobiia bacterium]|nr:hypothetical protein [Acidimicrobiia bacterium]
MGTKGRRRVVWFLLAMVVILVITLRIYDRVIHEPIPNIPAVLHDDLSGYLQSHRQDPSDYLLGKFEEHDIVLLGEFHRVKHEVEFVRDLIPRLWENGIHNLGIEFGSYDLQELSDSIVSAEQYDPDAAREMMFRWDPNWGYVEYLELYRAAWEVNSKLEPGQPRFRIINLDYAPDYTVLQENMTPDLWRQVWHKGDRDRYMADVVKEAVLDKHEKALVYCGRNHSFSKYKQPIFDQNTQKVSTYSDWRLGNLLRHEIGDKVMTVLFHSPWNDASSSRKNYPLGGAIDRVMLSSDNQPAGFDTHGTPFGGLTDKLSDYSRGYPELTLADVCDGYLFVKPITEFKGCTVDPQIVTSSNFKEAMTRYPTMFGRKILRWAWLYRWSMQHDANMKSRFRHLM